MRDTSSGSPLSQSTANGTISINTTYLVIAVWDTVADEITIHVNGVKEVDHVSTTMGNFFDAASSFPLHIGGHDRATPDLFVTGWEDHILVWRDALSDTAASNAWNSGAGKFWSIDNTPPAVADKVTRMLDSDADGLTTTSIHARIGTESDLKGAHLYRNPDAAAASSIQVLQDDGDDTFSWVTTGSVGTKALLTLSPGESDRFVHGHDPDQSDTDQGYFVTTIDNTDNESTEVKAVNGIPISITIPTAPTIVT